MVTLIARSRLLSSYPEEAAALVLAGLRADGVAVHLHTDVTVDLTVVIVGEE